MNETCSNAAAAKTNHQPGRPALSDRVRSLRLSDGVSMSEGRRSSWLPWTLCVLLALAAGYLVMDAMVPVDEATLKNAVDERLAELEKEAAAKGQTLSGKPSAGSAEGEVALNSKGYITPVHMIQVSPQVTGKVIELNFDEGMRVKKGDVLARLEQTEYQSYYDGAEARWQLLWKYRQDEIRQAQADLDDSKSQLLQLKTKSDRTEALWRAKSASPEDYEQAYYAYQSRVHVTQRMELALKLLTEGPRDGQIASAKAEMVKAKWQLDNCTIIAPLSGTILAKRAEVGNLVNPNAFANNGLPAGICDLADLADQEVDLSISELDIAKVFKGQYCDVRAEAYPDRPYKGFVSRIMPTGDRAKASVSVRVKIDIPENEVGQYLRPDMGARVTFYNKKA